MHYENLGRLTACQTTSVLAELSLVVCSMVPKTLVSWLAELV